MNILIAAVDEDWGIGKDGGLPWDFIEDRNYFRDMTNGSACIMGKNTYDDLCKYFKKDTLLPGRYPIVVSKTADIRHSNVRRFNSIQEAVIYSDMTAAKHNFFIGGYSIYKAAIDDALMDAAFLSHIPGKYDCDVKFPKDEFIKYNMQPMAQLTSQHTGIRYVQYLTQEHYNG